jgi:hypothetical protein
MTCAYALRMLFNRSAHLCVLQAPQLAPAINQLAQQYQLS